MQQCKAEQLLYQIRMPLGDKNKAQLFQHAVLLSMELSELGAVPVCFAITGSIWSRFSSCYHLPMLCPLRLFVPVLSVVTTPWWSLLSFFLPKPKTFPSLLTFATMSMPRSGSEDTFYHSTLGFWKLHSLVRLDSKRTFLQLLPHKKVCEALSDGLPSQYFFQIFRLCSPRESLNQSSGLQHALKRISRAEDN